MTIIEQLTYLKDKQYIVNSKFNVVVHLPIYDENWVTDFDLVFFADSGTVVYKEHIQDIDIILNIEIIDERKVAYITWK